MTSFYILFKLIGSLMVMAASGYLGFYLSGYCVKRPQELRTLQGLMQMFETEISFLSNILKDAFEKISKNDSSTVSAFFRETAVLLEKKKISASEAWKSALEKNSGKTSLNEEDLKILLSFGKMLGNSDLEGQVKNIRLTVGQLKLQEQKAEDNRRKNEKMYKSLGVLGGLAVVIILL